MSQPRLKDVELELYYQSLFDMYGSKGWKNLMEDFTALEESTKTVDGIQTREELWFRHGELSMLRRFLSHQAVSEQAYAGAVAEQEGVDEEAPTGGVARVVAE